MVTKSVKSLLYRYRQLIIVSIGIIWFALFGIYIEGQGKKLVIAFLFVLLTLAVKYISYEEENEEADEKKKGENRGENKEENKEESKEESKGENKDVTLVTNGKSKMRKAEKTYHIIAIASGKGGVGKTTIAANLGVTLSELHRKVVIIDMDLAMPNLEIIVGLKSPPVGLIDVLEGRLDLEHAIYSGPAGTKIIPPGIMLDGYSKEENREKIIKLFKNFPIETDYIILDMPPGREAIDVLYEGIEALLVINYDKASILDAINMRALLDRKGVKILGAILNRSEYDADLVDEIEKALDIKVVTVIPDSKVIKDSSNNEECFAVTKTESVPSKELVDLAKEIIGQ